MSPASKLIVIVFVAAVTILLTLTGMQSQQQVPPTASEPNPKAENAPAANAPTENAQLANLTTENPALPVSTIGTQAETVIGSGLQNAPQTTPLKYYFDVVRHSPDALLKVLTRAQSIYDQTQEQSRGTMQVVLVLHGPDITYFDSDNYEQYQEIVDLAASLDSIGVFDFKVCAASASNLGVAENRLPEFVELVPYGPAEVRRLEAAGYVRL